MFHVSLPENLFETLWHNGAQYINKSNVCQFFKTKIILEQYGTNLAQNDTNLYQLLKRFLEIFQHNCPIDISNISHFSKKILFCGKGQFGQKLCNLMICTLRIFLKLYSMMGYKRPMQCWSAFPINSLLVDRANPNLGQNYAALSDDFLSEIFFEMLLLDRKQQAHKSNSQFSQKISLGKNGQYGPNLSQNYATLYKDLLGGA